MTTMMIRLLLFATLLQAAPPDDPKAVAELHDVLRTLREERTAAYARRRARAVEIENARAPVQRLEFEISELKAREQEADKNLAEVGAELTRLRAEEQALAAQAAVYPAALKAAVDDAAAFVAAGPDYRRAERLARLRPEAPDLGRYWAFLQEELRLARSGEAYTGEVTLDGGRRKPARVFRVGHLLQGYVTEDGLEAGLEGPKGWAPAASPAQEQAIRDAVEMLDRRRPPGLLRFPVGASR